MLDNSRIIAPHRPLLASIVEFCIKKRHKKEARNHEWERNMCLRLTVASGAAQHSLQRNLPVCDSHSVGDVRVRLPKHVIV